MLRVVLLLVALCAVRAVVRAICFAQSRCQPHVRSRPRPDRRLPAGREQVRAVSAVGRASDRAQATRRAALRGDGAPRLLGAALAAAALAGCGANTDRAGVQADPELASVVRQVAELDGVEAVGAGRDGHAADLVITVAPGTSPERADELLDEGVRRLWRSELEPLSGIRVTVRPAAPAEGGTQLVYDEQDLERVRDELVDAYGDRQPS